MAQERIGVVIVDDHLMVAEALAEIVASEPDLDVLATAGSVSEALSVIGRTKPNVVVMDYHLPDGDGGSATKSIIDRWPDIAVIMLTGSGEHEALAKAIEAGCAGFLVKELHGIVITEAIRSVYRGELIIHAGSLHSALPNLRPQMLNSFELTPREMEMLKLLSSGASTQTLASQLFLSHHTVRNHIHNILTKLGAHSKLEAVAIAVREGIVTVEVDSS